MSPPLESKSPQVGNNFPDESQKMQRKAMASRYFIFYILYFIVYFVYITDRIFYTKSRKSSTPTLNY